MKTGAITRTVDRLSYHFVLGMIVMHGVAAAYYVKSALGIDIMEGRSILHDVLFG